jgi:hypothetical protein
VYSQAGNYGEKAGVTSGELRRGIRPLMGNLTHALSLLGDQTRRLSTARIIQRYHSQ